MENMENIEFEKIETLETEVKEPKKRGVKKGQKRGSYKKNKELKTNETVDNTTNINEYESINLNELKIDSEQKNTVEEVNLNNESTELINGYMLILIIDTLVPRVLRFFSKKQLSDLKLTSEEIKELEPLADVVAKKMLSKLSPETLFFIMLSVFYSQKI